VVIQIEQHYINSLSPKFNILKIAGSSQAYKHDDGAKAKISASEAPHLGIPKSEETKKKISGALLGIKRPETLKPHAKKIEVNYLELGGGSASPQKLFIILYVQQRKP
jgi:hypothetical protein